MIYGIVVVFLVNIKRKRIMTQELERLLEFANDLALLLNVDDKEVINALSDYFYETEHDLLFENALASV